MSLLVSYFLTTFNMFHKSNPDSGQVDLIMGGGIVALALMAYLAPIKDKTESLIHTDASGELQNAQKALTLEQRLIQATSEQK